MFQLDDLVLVTTDSNPDFNEEDFKAEAEKMFLANRYTQQFYSHLEAGTLTPGFVSELGDVLAECGVEPTDWVECIEDNASYAMSQGLIYVP